ncbi:hypothetical protein D9M71_677760 [compost metagenome]
MQRAIGEFLIETRDDPGVEVKDGAAPAFLFAQQGRDRIQHGQHLGIQPIHCQHQVIPGGQRLLRLDDSGNALFVGREHLRECREHVFQGHCAVVDRHAAGL